MSFAATESAPESNDATFETFDNFEDIAEEAEAADDDWSNEEPEAKKEKVSEDLKVIKDSQVDGEGKVIKEDKKAKEEDEDSEDGEEEESEEEEDSEEEEEVEEKEEEKKEEEEEDKPKSKLRMKMGNDLYNVTSDATFKVKVDGQVLDVPVQELINNYSGKTAWDKKFTDIGKEKKVLEQEKANVIAHKNYIVEQVNKALAPILDENQNPLDSLLYLVEMSGKDPYTAYRRLLEANVDEVGSLLDMTETERELYFHKKKDDLHGKIAKQRQEKQQKEQALNQTRQKVDTLRQAFNVSEDAFVEASQELRSLVEGKGIAVDEEAVVDYASLKPHISKIQELISPYEDNIDEAKYGEVVSQLARYLRDGKADEKSVAKLLKQTYSVEEDVKELNTRLYQKQKGKSSKKVEVESSGSSESFDDWE
jgi:hypothetical protein